MESVANNGRDLMPEQTRSECHNSDFDIIQTAPVSVAAVQAA